MTDFPNIARKAQGDPNMLTSREMQVNVIREDFEATHSASSKQERTERMAEAVPALLAHIDDLYGQIEYLRKKL